MPYFKRQTSHAYQRNINENKLLLNIICIEFDTCKLRHFKGGLGLWDKELQIKNID